MDWLHHPPFARQRVKTIELLRHDEYDFRKIKKVVFLCGGFRSARRDALNQYLKRFADDTVVFFAEAVWAVIANASPATNALLVEERLAELADIVIVIVESPGTFAEVGAFAISSCLRAKLLPILDASHKTEDSFLVTGPIRWVDADSQFAPTIWTDFDQLLVAGMEIESRLDRIPRTRPIRMKQAQLITSPKHLLFFVCDIVAVFGPCPVAHITDTVAQILNLDTPTVDINFYVALGKAMGLLGSFNLDGSELFFRLLRDGRLPSFQRKRHIDLATLRSEVLSAMQSCEPCMAALLEMGRQE